MRKLLLLVAAACCLSTFALVDRLAARARSSSTNLIFAGVRAVDPHSDAEPSNRAQAFPIYVGARGRVRFAGLFVDSGSQARTVRVGLYRDHAGRPGSLLTTGVRRRPSGGAWTQIRLPSAKLIGGRTYWLAILGTGGRLGFRDRLGGPCQSQESAQTDISRLPSRWSPGPRWTTCPLSAYLAITPAGVKQRPAPTTTPPPTHRLTHCISNLAACGYPDAGNNDGAHGALTPVSGTISLNRPGQVFENMDVNGSIAVHANNVTIKNVRVTAHGGHGIMIYSGNPHVPIDGTTIVDTTVRGASPTSSEAVTDGILNAGGNTHTTARRLYIYNSESTDWNGPGSISDSYMIVDTYAEGAHDEAVYEPGGDDGAQLNHDTLLNNQPQTAAVFFSADGGRGQHDSVTNSVLAGGGYLVYGAHGPTDPQPIDGPRITGNRLVRSPYGGYFNHGGSAGEAIAIDWSTDWSGNYWDDNLAAAR